MLFLKSAGPVWVLNVSALIHVKRHHINITLTSVFAVCFSIYVPNKHTRHVQKTLNSS